MAAAAGTVIKGEPQTSSSLNSSNVRINLDGVFEGDLEPLRVTAQSSPDMTVAVASDNDRAYVTGNIPLDYAGGNSGTFTAPVSGGDKRIDLLSIDSSRTLNITTGTDTSGTPSPPTYPSNEMVLAEIYLRNGMSSIKNTDDATNGYIFKARTPLFNLGGGSSFGVHKNNVDQTGVVDSTWTKVTWPNEDYDTNSNFASDRFTPTIAGKYNIISAVRVEGLADTKNLQIAIYKNGGDHRNGTTVPNGAALNTAAQVVTIVELNGTTDYLELWIRHTHGSNRTIAGEDNYTYFQGFKIAI